MKFAIVLQTEPIMLKYRFKNIKKQRICNMVIYGLRY
jgi:hypothetical protein